MRAPQLWSRGGGRSMTGWLLSPPFVRRAQLPRGWVQGRAMGATSGGSSWRHWERSGDRTKASSTAAAGCCPDRERAPLGRQRREAAVTRYDAWQRSARRAHPQGAKGEAPPLLRLGKTPGRLAAGQQITPLRGVSRVCCGATAPSPHAEQQPRGAMGWHPPRPTRRDDALDAPRPRPTDFLKHIYSGE